MPNLTIRLSEDDMDTLDRLASQWNLTRADVVRRLIRDFDNAVRGVREEACRVCSRLSAALLFESMLLNPMVVYHLINSNRDLVGDREFIVGWVVTTNHRVFFSTMDDLGRWLLKQARDYIRKYYGEDGGGTIGGRQTTEKPKVQAKPPAPKPPAGGPCYKVVVVYPDGTKRDAAEEITRGCRNEEVVEITPEEYQRYLKNEVTLDELVRKYRGTRSTANTATSNGSSTQNQPQQGKPQTTQAEVSAHTQNQPNNPQQPQTNKQVDLRNLPYLTLGEIAVRFGLLKLPNNNNRDRGAGGGA
jgi:hypothetical protein